MKRLSWLALALLGLLACNKQPEAAPTDVEKASAVATATPPTPPSVLPEMPTGVDVNSLPVEEQFEAEAEKELTSANLNAKLDELEKEISGP